MSLFELVGDKSLSIGFQFVNQGSSWLSVYLAFKRVTLTPDRVGQGEAEGGDGCSCISCRRCFFLRVPRHDRKQIVEKEALAVLP